MADINLGVGGANSATGGYEIANSLKFEDDNFEWIDSGTSTSTTSNKIGTISFWFKRTELTGADQWIWSGASSARYVGIRFDSNEKLKGYFSALGNGADFVSTQVFRDTSAWYHIVLAIDTTNSTAGDRFKIYVNGERITDWDTTPAIDQNTAIEGFEASARQAWAQYNAIYSDDAVQVSGYLAETYFINGQQLAASSFGEFDSDTGIWIPKEYTGTFGDKGYYLKFDDSSSLGADSSGNGNNFTLNNITAADQATDTPTNNFTTFNCIRRFNSDNLTVTDGGTVLVKNATSTWTTGFNTIAVNKGKWYWEGELYANEGYQMFGQTPQPPTEVNINIDWYLGKTADKSAGAGYYGSGEDVYYEGSYANSSASTAGDIISVAMDCDNNKVHFAVNGVYTNSSDPANNTNGFAMTDEYQYFAMATFLANTSYRANFGGYTTISISSAASDANGYGTFEYAPPSGYYALCSKNLAEYG